jgi:transposase
MVSGWIEEPFVTPQKSGLWKTRNERRNQKSMLSTIDGLRKRVNLNAAGTGVDIVRSENPSEALRQSKGLEMYKEELNAVPFITIIST